MDARVATRGLAASDNFCACSAIGGLPDRIRGGRLVDWDLEVALGLPAFASTLRQTGGDKRTDESSVSNFFNCLKESSSLDMLNGTPSDTVEARTKALGCLTRVKYTRLLQ